MGSLDARQFLFVLGVIVGVFLLLFRLSKPKQDNQFRDDAFSSRSSAGKGVSSGSSSRPAASGNSARTGQPSSDGPKLFLPAYVIASEKPWEILGILETASEADIKKAHKHLIRMCHPDRFSGEADRQRAAGAAMRINHAKDEMLRIRKTGRPS